MLEGWRFFFFFGPEWIEISRRETPTIRCSLYFFSQMAWLRFISLDFIKRVTFFPFYMSIKILLFVGNNWPVNWPGPSDRWTRWWVNEKHTSKKMITKNFLLKKAMIEKENSLGGHTRRFWLDSFTRRRTISIFRQKVQRRHFYPMTRFHSKKKHIIFSGGRVTFHHLQINKSNFVYRNAFNF